MSAKADYSYDIIKKFNCKFHIVTIDPGKTQASIIDNLNGQVIEQVSNLHQADIAINGGFFVVNLDGQLSPAGDLLVDNKIIAKNKQKSPLFIIKDGNRFSIINEVLEDISSEDHQVSAISGHPLLVENSQIKQIIYSQKTSFYNSKKARTAIAINNKK